MKWETLNSRLHKRRQSILLCSEYYKGSLIIVNNTRECVTNVLGPVTSPRRPLNSIEGVAIVANRETSCWLQELAHVVAVAVSKSISRRNLRVVARTVFLLVTVNCMVASISRTVWSTIDFADRLESGPMAA